MSDLSEPNNKAEVSDTKWFDDIYSLIVDLKGEIKNVEKNLGDTINKLYDRLEESIKVIEVQGTKLNQCFEEIDGLKKENQCLKSKLSECENRSNDIEQRMLENNVEIHGLPSSANENLPLVLCNICAALGVQLNENSIDYCYRSKPKPSGESGGIQVRFRSQKIKEEFLTKRRVKRDFGTRHLSLEGAPPPNTPIYINEALTSGRRKVLNAAREAKKTNNYAYLWIRGGKILMRKAEKKPVIVLRHLCDLSKL